MVVTHGGARVGVASGDLHVAQVDAGVEHGGDEGVPQHVRVHPRGVYPTRRGEAVQTPGGAVTVHPGAAPGPQDRPVLPIAHGPLDRAGHRRRQWGEHHLPALAAHFQDAVSVLLAQVLDVRATRLEDPQPEQAQHGD